VAKISHTINPRVGQNEANAAIATVVTFTGTTIVCTGAITSASAANNAGNGATFSAGAVSGGNVTFTGSGTPLKGDGGSITINGETLAWKVSVHADTPPLTLAHIIAGIQANLTQYLVNGDTYSFIAADKKTSDTTTSANCVVAGLAHRQLADGRPTTTTNLGSSFPTGGNQIVRNDVDTTVA